MRKATVGGTKNKVPEKNLLLHFVLLSSFFARGAGMGCYQDLKG